MSLRFEMKGTRELIETLKDTQVDLTRGAIAGVEEILDDWRVEAMDIAPYLTGTLHDSIHAEPVAKVLNIGDVSGTISANAVKSGFNYAYYIHEETKRAVTGDSEFLATPVIDNEERWETIFERAVVRDLGRWWK